MNTFREVLELARDNDVSGQACYCCCAR